MTKKEEIEKLKEEIKLREFKIKKLTETDQLFFNGKEWVEWDGYKVKDKGSFVGERFFNGKEWVEWDGEKWVEGAKQEVKEAKINFVGERFFNGKEWVEWDGEKWVEGAKQEVIEAKVGVVKKEKEGGLNKINNRLSNINKTEYKYSSWNKPQKGFFGFIVYYWFGALGLITIVGLPIYIVIKIVEAIIGN